MKNLPALKRRLQEFGLSENQALIYLILIEHRELRIQEIVRLAQMPRSSVYESLRALSAHGLTAEIVEENHKKIRPYPISAMRHALQEKMLELQKLTGGLEELDEVLTNTTHADSLRSTTVRYYKDVAGARQLFWNTLKAQSTMYVYSAFGRSKFVGKKFYMDFVAESADRGIREMVLINPTARALGLIKRDNESPLARTKIDDIRALPEKDISITGETFIYDNVYAQVYVDTEHDTTEINGFEIESTQFTDSQRSIFETLWGMAQPLDQLLEREED